MRNLNTKISIFNLNGYIESNKKIIKLIDQKLKEKGLSIRELSRNTSISHTVIIDFLKGSSMKIKNLEKIIRFIKIDNIYIEKLNPLLHSSPYKFRKYNLKFPLKLNPLNIRVVAHFLGDSSLEARGCRWYQKSEIGGDYMVRLIKKLSGITIKKGTKDSYGIPTILGDIVCYALNLQRIELKSSSLIKKLNYLPKEYKIQLLAAIIVDEGSVLKSNIKIYNTNLKIMKELKQLIESLGYSCSAIKINKRRHKKILIIKGQEAKMNYDLHIIWIHAASLLKFKEDLDKTIKKYGNIAGLWHKQKDLIKWGERVDLKRIKKTKMSKKKIIPLIKKEIKKNPLKVLEFAKEQDLDYIRAYKLFFRLKQKGKIKKISTGVFASNNYII